MCWEEGWAETAKKEPRILEHSERHQEQEAGNRKEGLEGVARDPAAWDSVSRECVARLLAAQGMCYPSLSRRKRLCGQLARKGVHDALSDYLMQDLGLAVNALSPRPGATPKLERSPFTVDQTWSPRDVALR